MRERQGGPAAGLIAQVLLLAVLAATVGLGAAGWVVGVACAGAMAAALSRALVRAPRERLGPASWVTLVRATLTVGVAALVGDSFAGGTPVGCWWCWRRWRWGWICWMGGWRGGRGRRRRWGRGLMVRSMRF